MELFIENLDLESKHKINGVDRPLSEWKGVTLNEQNDVIKIQWELLSLKGMLGWEWLPSSIKIISVYSNKLCGKIYLNDLPEKLENLDASYNQFAGTVDFTNLPEYLDYLNISCNSFSGKVVLTKLPPNLRRLDISDNKFTERVDFSNLPQGLHYNDEGNNFGLEDRISIIRLRESHNVAEIVD
ncbi:MAG: hypothetical protein AAGG81_09010 [Chlamydiota bacterium]